MPSVSASTGATVPATTGTTKKEPISFVVALNRMHWDTALALVMASDPYYHYTTPQERSQEQTTAAAENETTTDMSSPPREYWFRRYVVSSSKTRLLVHVGVVGYLVYVLTHPSRYVPCHVVAAAGSEDVAAATTTDCYLYQGAEGMQLLMRGPMPKWAVLPHAVAGTLLLPLAIAQKESVWYMPFARRTMSVEEGEGEERARHATAAAGKEAAHTYIETRKVHLCHAKVTRRRHGNCGFLTGVCVFVMVVGGVSLRSYSVFSAPSMSARAGIINFASAMFLFAAPWALLTPATTGSGVQANAAAHAMLGGVLIKAILAVPFERVLGGVWQRLAGVHVALPPPLPRSWFSWNKAGDVVNTDSNSTNVVVEITQQMEGQLERVYYKSILATTIVFGVWGIVDIVRFVRLARKVVMVEEKAKK